MSRFHLLTTWLAYALMLMCSGTKADCPQGQYRASPGLCCLLCPAGTFKADDCSTEGGYAHCLSCNNGRYTDGDNQEPRCLTCTVCGQHEVIQQDCKATQNRKCVCDVGFYRPENGDSCQEKSRKNPYVAIVAGVGVLGLVFVAGVVYLAYLWRCQPRKDAASEKKALEEAMYLYLNGVHKNETVQQPQPRDKLETTNEQERDQERQLKEHTVNDERA